jgi:hypothetical protein
MANGDTSQMLIAFALVSLPLALCSIDSAGRMCDCIESLPVTCTLPSLADVEHEAELDQGREFATQCTATLSGEFK